MITVLLVAAAVGALGAGARLAAEAGSDAARPMTVSQDTLGRSIFMGKGTCFACHGPEAKGTPLAPDLTDSTWLHITPTVASIDSLIKTGVPQPKEAALPMLPRAGVQLTDAEVAAVARYVFSLSRSGGITIRSSRMLNPTWWGNWTTRGSR